MIIPGIMGGDMIFRMMDRARAQGKKVTFITYEFNWEDRERMERWFDSLEEPDPADWWKGQP